MTDWLKQLLDNVQTQKQGKAPWFDGYSPIFIYGTGTFAQDILQIITDHGLPIHGFIDHIEREKTILNGIRILKPESIQELCQTGRTPVVILGIHNSLANIPLIIQRLKECNINKIVSTIDLYDYFGSELGSRYWLTSRDFYLPMENVFEELLKILSDETSRVLFHSILEYRLSGNVFKLPQPDTINTYHPHDIPAWKLPLRFVDCGAFDGDTLQDFRRNGFGIEAVAAFEPDILSFNKLVQYISNNQDSYPNAYLWPCGVFSKTGEQRFETGQGTASRLSNNGSTKIQCIALDDAIPTFNPNLIKMDIEGAEYDALLGAQNLINAYQPGLAISLYHRPEHLWQIPLLVNRVAPGKYQFMMRMHAMNDFELVLYAIPNLV